MSGITEEVKRETNITRRYDHTQDKNSESGICHWQTYKNVLDYVYFSDHRCHQAFSNMIDIEPHIEIFEGYTENLNQKKKDSHC